MGIIRYSQCPVCGSTNIRPLMGVRDHSVSKEQFDIWLCTDCELRFTQNIPGENDITSYYQSEDYISHTNTSRGLLNKVYQQVRNITLADKCRLVIKHTNDKGRLLDVGAGVGAYLNAMKQRNWNVQGIEPDEGARQKAKELFDIELNNPSTFDTLTAESFDAITMWHVLEHVHDLHPYMSQLKALLKKDGKLFIAVPNYQSLDADIYKSFWAAYDVPRHLYHFSPQSMKVLLQKHGFHVDEMKPMWFDSFYISLLSSKYKFGKTKWISSIWNGMRSNINGLFNRKKVSSLIYIASKQL